MQASDKQTKPEADKEPKGELMKCPKCGHDTFAMGESIVYDEVRWRRIPAPKLGGTYVRPESDRRGYGYDDLHIVCNECGATYWESTMMEMWETDGVDEEVVEDAAA